MLHVDNEKMLRTVTRRFMKANRSRNIIIIIAVVMTTVMFTALFTAAGSLLMTGQQMEMKTMMDTSHIRASMLSKTQFDRIRKDPDIKVQGYTVYLAPAENRLLGNSRAELQYGNKKGAESRMSVPTKGRMPKGNREIAMSTITMDLLGVPHEIGAKVSLTYTLGGKTETETFTLSGYWKGEQTFPSQPIWVSKAFCTEKLNPAEEASVQKGNSEGTYDLAMWFSSPFGLTEKMENLDRAYGISKGGGQISVNTAYDIFGNDGFDFISAAVVFLVVFAAGNLIIFNVFNLSVKNDMKAYGLLKNIGVTGKQLKKIVRTQALYLSAAGIPAGLLLGFFAGKVMTPHLVDSMDYSQEITVITAASPMLFVSAAAFSAVTVYFGCLRPALFVSKLSPVEAAKEASTSEKSVGKKHGKKSMQNFSPLMMAFGNFRKNRKKAVVVIISLALPIIILNSIYSIAKGFHYEYFVDAYINMDFQISGCTNFAKTSNQRAVTDDFIEAVSKRKEVKSAAVVYNTENVHKLNREEAETLRGILESPEVEKNIGDYQLQKEWRILENMQAQAHVMGLNRDAFDEITFLDQKCTFEEFSEGNYVIAGTQTAGGGQYYKTGDRVLLDLGKGVRAYTVLAIGELNYELEYPFAVGTYFDYTFMLPEQAYEKLLGEDSGALVMGVEVKPGTSREFDNWLQKYIETEEKSLYVKSKLSLEEEARDFAAKYYLVLGLLCAVLFVIGVMNFFNTMSMSVLSRKKELALLEAVGMTGKQIAGMLIAEGVFYLLSALALADTLGAVLSLMVIKKTVGNAFFFTAQMSVSMSIFALPILLLIAVAVPLYLYRRLKRQAVVERLRVE